jgi:hypothetical protein
MQPLVHTCKQCGVEVKFIRYDFCSNWCRNVWYGTRQGQPQVSKRVPEKKVDKRDKT